MNRDGRSDRSNTAEQSVGELGAWDRFWFEPRETSAVAWIRGLLAFLAIIFFLSAWTDISFWYVDGGPLSRERVASFLETGDLQDAGRWILSPLFLSGSVWVYRAYLLLSVVMAIMVILGKGGRLAGFGLWLLFVGWANRSMILSGLAETLISLGLFAAAIAPPQAAFHRLTRIGGKVTRNREWSANFGLKLMAMQITVVGFATFVTMLAGRVWFNGIGVYALAAPAQDLTIDWTRQGSPLVNPFVHETLTHLMMIALPLGFAMAWIPRTNRLGQSILITWCAVVALIASHWLYAFTFACLVLAIQPSSKSCAT